MMAPNDGRSEAIAKLTDSEAFDELVEIAGDQIEDKLRDESHDADEPLDVDEVVITRDDVLYDLLGEFERRVGDELKDRGVETTF